MTTDKHYYYPPSTKNIMFTKGETYICLRDIYTMKKGEHYFLYKFKNYDWFAPIYFIDNKGSYHKIHSTDCGYLNSLKNHRKIKLERLKER